MNTTRWIAAVLISCLIGVFAGFGWGKVHHAKPDNAGLVPASAVSGAATPDRKVLYWHDPMKPEVKFDQPGKSPFMDMPLQPVYADDLSVAGGVTVSSAAQQNLGVRLGRVEKKVVAQSLTTVGNVAYDEHNAAVVQARVGGYVSQLRVRAPLDRVRRGQILAEIVAPEWIEAEGEYVSLLTSSASNATAMQVAARARLVVLGIPEAVIGELENTRVVPTTTPVYAPIDGVVAELGVRDGAAFSADTLLFRINGLATVWVNAQVPESSAARVMAGSVVESRSIAWPGEVFGGHVLALLPQVDSMTRTRTVRIAVDNRNGRLTPGMFVQTTFTDRTAAPQLWLPSEAVIVTGIRSVVIIRRDAGPFAVIDVTVGSEANGQTAIVSGLSEGESVVLSGQFLIDSEASLQSTLNRLSAGDTTVPRAGP